MAQSQVRTVLPIGGALERARRAVERASVGYETHLDLECDPRPVLAMLLREAALDRALLLLERDGPNGRIAILPRRASGPPSVTELFEEDHVRLHAIGNALCEEVKAGRPNTRRLAQLLIDGLRRHIRIEEEVLFPLFEAQGAGTFRANTMLMRREHVALERYLVDMDCAMERGSVPPRRVSIEDFLRAYWGLGAVLADHNVKEERALFPVIDRAMEAIDRYELFRRIVLF